MLTSIRRDLPIKDILHYVRCFTRYNSFGRPGDTYDVFYWRLNHEIAKECAEDLKDFGFTGGHSYGVTKVVFPHESGWVLKVPLISAFRKYLVKEAFVMTRAPKEFAQYFPRNVLKWDCLFQEKCPPDEMRYNLHRDEIDEVGAALGLFDLHCANVGFNQNDEFKIIDAQTAPDLMAIRDFRRAA